MVCNPSPDAMSEPSMSCLSSLPDQHLIRSMQPEDLPAVHAIECSCQTHPWTISHFEAEMDNPVASVDVYLWDRVVAGFLCSWLIAGELQIQNLGTAESFRRKGVAGRLLRHVLERSRQAGMAKAWLEVRADNFAAVTLYRQSGFVEMARRPQYYHDGEDALIMCLSGDGG